MISIGGSTAFAYQGPQFSDTHIWVYYIQRYVGTVEAQGRGTLHLYNTVLSFQPTHIMCHLSSFRQELWISHVAMLAQRRNADVHIILASDVVFYILGYLSRF
jgi:hypothetical protein